MDKFEIGDHVKVIRPTSWMNQMCGIVSTVYDGGMTDVELESDGGIFVTMFSDIDLELVSHKTERYVVEETYLGIKICDTIHKMYIKTELIDSLPWVLARWSSEQNIFERKCTLEQAENVCKLLNRK
jgi:hypothetical protein